MSSRARSASLVLIAVIAGLTAPAAADAAAKPKVPCPKHSGGLYADNSGWIRVWHDRLSVYACSPSSYRWSKTQQRHIVKFATKRLGPWGEGSTFSYDYVSDTAIWLRPQGVGAGRVTRLWAAGLSGNQILRRVPARPGVNGTAADGDFGTLKFGPAVLAWTSGDAAFMVPLGGTASVQFGEGIATAPVTAGPIVALGVWPGAAESLAATLRIDAESGDADECGGGGTYTVSVNPAGTPVEARSSYGYDGKCYGL